jgi:hypothetical protein
MAKRVTKKPPKTLGNLVIPADTWGFSPEKRRIFLNALRKGYSVTACCGLAHIYNDTVYKLLGRAKLPTAKQADIDFAIAFHEARSIVEGELTDIVKAAGAQDWKATESILRRQFRAEWGDPREPEKAADESASTEFTKEQWAALAELITKTKG